MLPNVWTRNLLTEDAFARNDLKEIVFSWTNLKTHKLFDSKLHAIWVDPDLIFVTNITKYIRGEKIAMWRNFTMYDNCGEIENISTCRKISVQLMGFYCNLCRFVAKSLIHASGEKLCPNYICGEKMTNIRSGRMMS